LDPQSRAKQDIAREATGALLWKEKLANQFPDHAPVLESMFRNLQEFVATGETPLTGYWEFRYLYFQTAGVSNDEITSNLSRIFPPLRLPKTIQSSLGDYRATEVSGIVSELKKHGFARLKNRLSPDSVAVIRQSLEQTAANPAESGAHDGQDCRIFFREPTLLACPQLAQLAADPLFYHVVSQYLGVQPILSFLTAWISRRHLNDQETLSESAQLFHADMSNPAFLKIFIYLNNVTEKNGPHCLIPGTHRQKAQELWRDGRISNEDISKHYPESTWDYQTGEAGSVFFVDTKAFHKGVPVVEGERFLIQLYYVDTLFGEYFPLDPETPPFDANRFGPAINSYGPRFLSRYALGR
ncbi:MAG: phytanoyl-CoA dioxygenase family protein, partial [Verrucomicrobia bacterium]|nr:phytanoyl-CoA dioxygenase family protein [Verrucomicrobiota bacterium]